MAPHAGTVNNIVCFNSALQVFLYTVTTITLPADTADTSIGFIYSGDFDSLYHRCSVLTRPFGQSQGYIGWIALTILFQIDRASNVADIQMRVTLFDLRWRDFLYQYIKGPRHRCLPVDFFLALFSQRNGNRPASFKAGGDTGFLFQFTVELLAVFSQPGHVFSRA